MPTEVARSIPCSKIAGIAPAFLFLKGLASQSRIYISVYDLGRRWVRWDVLIGLSQFSW